MLTDTQKQTLANALRAETNQTVVSAPAASTIPSVTAQKIIGSPGIRLYNGTCLLHGALTSATTATFFSGELTIMEK